MRSKSSQLHPSTEFDYGPLFGGGREYVRERVQSTAVDPNERLTWARRALLASNLTVFGAEDVRRLVVSMRPHYLGSGRWIGFVFRCPLFEMVGHEHTQRPEAKSRWILSYQLSPEGRSARAEIVRRSRCGAGPSLADASGSSPDLRTEDPPDGEPVGDKAGRQCDSRPVSESESSREGQRPGGFHTPAPAGAAPAPAPNNSHGGIENEWQ